MQTFLLELDLISKAHEHPLSIPDMDASLPTEIDQAGGQVLNVYWMLVDGEWTIYVIYSGLSYLPAKVVYGIRRSGSFHIRASKRLYTSFDATFARPDLV